MKPYRSPLKLQRGGDFFDMKNIQYIWDNYIVANFTEQIRILPDSILLGSALLSFITQSYSTTVLFLSLIEATAIGIAIKNLFGFFDMNHMTQEPSDTLKYCVSGSVSPTLETVAYLGRDSIASAFPSFPIYFLATASSYIVGSMLMQKDELEALGPSYSSRFYLSTFISSLLILVVSTYRLYYHCEGVGTVIATFLLGLIVGAIILYQNTLLLGRDSTNLTGIPLLRERTRDKKPLYVCPQKA
jgi:hypothetical protein